MENEDDVPEDDSDIPTDREIDERIEAKHFPCEHTEKRQ